MGELAYLHKQKTRYKAQYRQLVLRLWFRYRDAAILFDQPIDFILMRRFCSDLIEVAYWLNFEEQEIDFLRWQIATKRRGISLSNLYRFAKIEGLKTLIH